MPEGSAAAGGHSAEGDWAAMAVWDLLTPSTSQGPVGTWLRGTLWGAAMAVWDLQTPSYLTGACGDMAEGNFVGGGHGCVGPADP